MEPEFFLPYIDEITRITQANQLTSSSDNNASTCGTSDSDTSDSDTSDSKVQSSPLNRFYSSDLFDRNVLSIVKEFAEIKYDIRVPGVGHKVIKAVEYDFTGMFDLKILTPVDDYNVRVIDRVLVKIKTASGNMGMGYSSCDIRYMLNSDRGILDVQGGYIDRLCRKFLKMLLS